MIGIARNGLIIFISPSFGGGASDKFIFMYSKILEKCEGDIVMADKEFLIKNECKLDGVQLVEPPFLKIKANYQVKNTLTITLLLLLDFLLKGSCSV